ncbi:ribonuclease H-like domain-containing protein [Tanacetum coccineum]
MNDEYNALIKNNTWTLVPRPADTNVVRCMCCHKYHVDGTLSLYKARLVANGSTQLEGVDVDVDETFSPVVKPSTIRIVLSLATSRHSPVHQLDVKNAFLHGDLTEIVYMHQPHSFWDSVHPDYTGVDIAYLLLYVGDIVLTASSETLLDPSGMFLSHRKYVTEILEWASMLNSNPSRTHVDTESKLGDGVQLIYLYMHDPRESYFSALKRILRYVRGTLGYGLQLFSSTTIDLVAYRMLTGAEAEYHGVANVVAETCWLRNLLCELHTPLSSATLVYCDNVSTVYLPCNPIQRQRTNHIEIASTLFVIWLQRDKSEFYMFLRVISLRIFSPNACLQRCLKSLNPV